MPLPVTRLTLVHVPVSHYSEKARWALDHKRIPHTRRWPPGGTHPLVTWLLTRGQHQTVPVLVMDGEGIGDSTEIIRRLEERFPEPPLYPAEPAERRRALELEDYFDEQLGPYTRRLVYHHLTSDPELLAELAAHQVQWGLDSLSGVSKRVLKLFLNLRFATDDPERAKRAEEKVVAALDRLDAELEGREYLAGDGFSVADLTAASLLYPIALPPQTPWRPSRLPDAWLDFNTAHGDRPSVRYVLKMYRRHR
ncbi:MAG: glutathione S-transferase [Thermoleophilaceae bacterium]|nr:glutathione S-transferase [Thermoleophilaceae bacterium]